MPLRQPSPTADDLNGPEPMKSNMDLYLEKYGTLSLTLLISTFVKKAPEFPGDEAIAGELGQALAMLEAALIEVSNSKEVSK